MPYWHELTAAEREAMADAGWTWGEAAEAFAQPNWCSYPNALAGALGCWSLIFGFVTGIRVCSRCPLCRPLVSELTDSADTAPTQAQPPPVRS